jgi:hypothetical protein
MNEKINDMMDKPANALVLGRGDLRLHPQID